MSTDYYAYLFIGVPMEGYLVGLSTIVEKPKIDYNTKERMYHADGSLFTEERLFEYYKFIPNGKFYVEPYFMQNFEGCTGIPKNIEDLNILFEEVGLDFAFDEYWIRGTIGEQLIGVSGYSNRSIEFNIKELEETKNRVKEKLLKVGIHEEPKLVIQTRISY